MTEIYDRALAPSGVKITMFRVLRRLSSAGDPTISELAELVGLERSSLGRNLRVLERDGLVTFIEGVDERSKIVRLTAKGRRALENALPLWSDVQTKMKSSLAHDRDAIFGVLTKLTEQLGAE